MSVPVMDYPQAWAYIREHHSDPEKHNEACSWRMTNGAILCDCALIWAEYARRRVARAWAYSRGGEATAER